MEEKVPVIQWISSEIIFSSERRQKDRGRLATKHWEQREATGWRRKEVGGSGGDGHCSYFHGPGHKKRVGQGRAWEGVHWQVQEETQAGSLERLGRQPH